MDADGHGHGADVDSNGWYRWGRVVLYAEMVVATLITVFSLYLAFQGTAGFLA